MSNYEFLGNLDCPFQVKARTGRCGPAEEAFEGVAFRWDGDDLRFEVRPEDADRFQVAMGRGDRITLEGAVE